MLEVESEGAMRGGEHVRHPLYVVFLPYNHGNGKLHPGRLTWNIQITHLERNMIFQTSMIMFHVNLPGTQNKKETQLENTHFRLKHDDGHHLQGSDFEQKTIRDPMFFLL